MTPPQTYYIEVPVKTWPRLPKGNLHKLQITPESLEIKSYENMFGNANSMMVLSVMHSNISQIELIGTKFSSSQNWVRITYKNEFGKELRLKFCAVAANASFNNHNTKTIATILEELRWNREVLLREPIVISLNPPTSLKKFLAGLSLFAGAMLLGGLGSGQGFVLLLGTFILFPSLIALGIDYVRLNTAWHPAIKFVSYISIFLVGFVMLVTAFAFMDAYNFFG